METNNLRNTVCSMLIRTLEQGELSHIVLQEIYENDAFSDKERAFVKRLYNGTLERLIYLDYFLDKLSSVPVRKMKSVIRNILRVSLYQMWFMDSVPVYTAINEGVNLARKRGFQNLSAFVNGVLRMADRKTKDLSVPAYVRACAPEWIYDLLAGQYGTEETDSFFQAVRNDMPETRIRLCVGKNSPEQILQSLREDGCEITALIEQEHAYAISGFGRLKSLRAYQQGDIVIQDPSSLLAAREAIRDIPEPHLVIDVCAAPGGKSLYIAGACPDARIIARDLTEPKAERIRENIRRLGISNIEVQIFDAREEDPALTGKADVVVADLPCSGLGVIGRKPDILYRLTKEDLGTLAGLQQQILGTVQNYVRKGGTLLYSTCTVNQSENSENVRWFLQNYPFELVYEKQYLPGRDPYDGFYIARLRRI